MKGINLVSNVGRPKAEIKLTSKERKELNGLISSRSSSNATANRARIILLSASGKSDTNITKHLVVDHKTVRKWREKFIALRVSGLCDDQRPGRSKATLKLDESQVVELRIWADSRSLPSNLVVRAKIVLQASQGKSNNEIAASLSINPSTVAKWRRKYIELGISGLHDEYRPGAPRTYSEERIAELINKTLETKPEGETHWSCRSFGQEHGISSTTVNRIWNMFGIQPHRTKGFKLSNDPFFIEKVKDVVGLYLAPPTNAVVLCVDEKSQCQALERTQPILPLGLGYAEGVTDNYFRHGTTTLFAALDIATGEVCTMCNPRHRHQEFIGFLNKLNRNIPENLDVHVIVDNYATHKHMKVRAWLARHPRFQFHFTPTYSSWLNQVERWFAIITDKSIRRGNFKNVRQLVAKIDEFVVKYNQNPKPFIWVKTAVEIIEKVKRLCERIQLGNKYPVNL